MYGQWVGWVQLNFMSYAWVYPTTFTHPYRFMATNSFRLFLRMLSIYLCGLFEDYHGIQTPKLFVPPSCKPLPMVFPSYSLGAFEGTRLVRSSCMPSFKSFVPPPWTWTIYHHWAQESVLCKHSPSYELSMNVENVSTTSLLAIARSLTLSSSRQHVGHRIVLPNHMMNLKVKWFNIGYPSQRGYIWSWASRKYPEDRMTICLN